MYEQYIAILKAMDVTILSIERVGTFNVDDITEDIFYTYLVDDFIEQIKNNIVFTKSKD